MTQFNYTDKLYHYSTVEKVIGLILPNRELRLGELKHTNDPKENQEFLFAKRYFGEQKYNNTIISNLLLEDCKVLCFSEYYKSKFGFEHPNMWAHYGQNHEGICIELDINKFKEENSEIIKASYFENVKYEKFNGINLQKNASKIFDEIKADKIGFEKYVKNQFRKKQYKSLYYTKWEEWKYEFEKRLIYFSSKKEEEYCHIENSITGIYLGFKFNNKYLKAIEKLSEGTWTSKLKYKEGRLKPENGIDRANF